MLAAAAFAAWRQGDLRDRRAVGPTTASRSPSDPSTGPPCTDTMATVHLLENRPGGSGPPVAPGRRRRRHGARAAWRPVPSPPPTRATSTPALRLARQALDGAVAMGGPHHRGVLPVRARRAADGHRRRAGRAAPPTGRRDRPARRWPGSPAACAHVTLVTLWQRRGDLDAALGGYRDLVERWWQSGSWTQAWTTLRNLAPLLAEQGERATALLVLTTAAHDPAAPATSDAEGQRLEAVRAELEAELGPVATAGGGTVVQGGPGRDRPSAASGMTAGPVPGPCKVVDRRLPTMRTTADLGTLLGVWAHPDDEAYLCAGLMAAARDAGHRVVSVTATLGEHGTGDPERWPPERLAPLRAAELAAALDVLGVDEPGGSGTRTVAARPCRPRRRGRAARRGHPGGAARRDPDLRPRRDHRAPRSPGGRPLGGGGVARGGHRGPVPPRRHHRHVREPVLRAPQRDRRLRAGLSRR